MARCVSFGFEVLRKAVEIDDNVESITSVHSGDEATPTAPLFITITVQARHRLLYLSDKAAFAYLCV